MGVYIGEKYSQRGRPQLYLYDNQTSVFEQWFANDPYPTQQKITKLSKMFGLDKGKVYNWFSAKRKQLRRHKIPLPIQCKLYIKLYT